MIEPSHFDPAEAWAAVDRHRLEDYKPHIYHTRDYGKTWTALRDDSAAPTYINSVKEDPARRGLLYAATELGVIVSFVLALMRRAARADTTSATAISAGRSTP